MTEESEVQKPSIALIVSVFNQAWLARCVFSSIESQMCSVPFEVIFCDDGSDDSFYDLLRNWCVTAPLNVRYIWQPKSGFRLSRSRNNAIRCSTADVLVFADGDTWLSPSFLEDHWRCHSNGLCLV